MSNDNFILSTKPEPQEVQMNRYMRYDTDLDLHQYNVFSSVALLSYMVGAMNSKMVLRLEPAAADGTTRTAYTPDICVEARHASVAISKRSNGTSSFVPWLRATNATHAKNVELKIVE